MIITDPDVDPFQATSNPVSDPTLKQCRLKNQAHFYVKGDRSNLESGSERRPKRSGSDRIRTHTYKYYMHNLMQCAYQ
jgi:hypothetical protein